MQPLQVVDEDRPERESSPWLSSGMVRTFQWTIGIVILFAFGSWLMWFSAYLQRSFVEEEIRAACQRVMPDTVQRCVDTVILQRGGSRR